MWLHVTLLVLAAGNLQSNRAFKGHATVASVSHSRTFEWNATRPRTFLWNSTALLAAREKVAQGHLASSVAVAVRDGQAALELQPRSVMDKKYLPPSGDKHDYMSLDKYYWPCNNPPPSTLSPPPSKCDNSTGLPWVRHDGITNPAMRNYDHDALVNVTEAVIKLGIAFYFTGVSSHTFFVVVQATQLFKLTHNIHRPCIY